MVVVSHVIFEIIPIMTVLQLVVVLLTPSAPFSHPLLAYSFAISSVRMIRDDNEITQTIDWNRELWGIYVRSDALILLSNGDPNIYGNISS